MVNESSENVKKIERSKLFKLIKKDLLDQLEANGTCGKYFEDLVDDYMTMYITKTLLATDIKKRGNPVVYDNGGGQKGFKKNESIELFHKTNAQMLKLISELGLRAIQQIGAGDPDDPL
ncbi:P27 family phage terminase small subunit [Diplocloster modestus]|uniref:RNA polymerase subunit sigma-70 n=1 Tax=Diplocloster modestus TaxID=2850322 RepID=A0ABS6KCQ9_9FIRM|nr:P27 family phage terminase small subunit [Diplocloster modestus]MBU9728278.1 RNA polymerase subunit sigma-70 [Diplocloster modestus]